jgi:tetratricopeptide (TPR) repeat protein
MFEKALALRPDDGGLWNRLGNAYWRAGAKSAEAIAAEDRATRLDPKNALYAYNLGFMRADTGEFDPLRPCAPAVRERPIARSRNSVPTGTGRRDRCPERETPPL